MPQIIPPDPGLIASWAIGERGVGDGSSPNESIEIQSNTAERKRHWRWSDRFRVMQWLLGYSQLYIDNNNIVRLSRLLPQVHPEQPTWAVTKVSTTGLNWQSFININNSPLPINTFARAEIKELYEQVPYNLLPDGVPEISRYVEYPAGDPEPSAEYLALPGAAFYYTADPGDPIRANGPINGRPIASNIGKIVPQEIFKVAWHRLPIAVWQSNSPLYQRIYGTGALENVPYFGCINSQVFFGREPGTCLFSNVKPYRRASPTGVGYELDIYYEFTYKPSGWNWVYGFDVGDVNGEFNGWYLCSASKTFATADLIADDDSIFNARDLNLLFQVG